MKTSRRARVMMLKAGLLIAAFVANENVGLAQGLILPPPPPTPTRPAVASAGPTVEATDDHFTNPRFDPAALTIHAGDSVTFKNTGTDFHTATAKDGSWDAGNLNPGDSKSITFDKQGTFDYICRYHEALRMVGKITVLAAEGASSSSAPSNAGADNTRPSTHLVADAAPTTPARARTLPSTGSELLFLGIGGVILVALGGLLVRASARRAFWVQD